MDGDTAVVTAARSWGILRPGADRLARLGAWFDDEYDGLLRFAYFVTGDAATAEDLVQDAFVKMSGARGRIDDPAFPAYVRRTIVNLSRSRWRRRMREQAAVTARPDAVDPADRIDGVWREVRRLPAQQRACVALRYYDDLPEREVAQILGVSVGTVKKQTHRALQRLRAALGDWSET